MCGEVVEDELAHRRQRLDADESRLKALNVESLKSAGLVEFNVHRQKVQHLHRLTVEEIRKRYGGNGSNFVRLATMRDEVAVGGGDEWDVLQHLELRGLARLVRHKKRKELGARPVSQVVRCGLLLGFDRQPGPPEHCLEIVSPTGRAIVIGTHVDEESIPPILEHVTNHPLLFSLRVVPRAMALAEIGHFLFALNGIRSPVEHHGRAEEQSYEQRLPTLQGELRAGVGSSSSSATPTVRTRHFAGYCPFLARQREVPSM
jgi:hypothetical protein